MSDIFKLRVDIGTSHIELEGEGTLVHTIFSELREHGLGKLSATDQLASPTALQQKNKLEFSQDKTISDNKQASLPIDSVFDLPNIRDIVIKNLPKTEAEWILVYALYCSEQGTKTFTAEDIRQMYRDSNRHTENRRKNFTTNLNKCVSNSSFTCINDTEYSLSASGKTTAIGILNRTSEDTNPKKKKTGQAFAKSSYQFVELGLDQQQREEMKKYIDSFSKLNNIEKALILANWLKVHASCSEVNEHTIFSALKTVGYSTSFDIKGALANGKNKNNYFSAGVTTGYYQVHHIGEDHITELEAKRG